MNIIRQYVRCKTCGKTYSFHPGVGDFRCPNCHAMNDPIENKVSEGESVIARIFRGKAGQ